MREERFFRQLYWVSARHSLVSRNHDRQLFKIFSKILLRVFRRDMGRYEEGREGFLKGLSRGITSAILHARAKEPAWNMRLKMDVRWVMELWWRCLSMEGSYLIDATGWCFRARVNDVWNFGLGDLMVVGLGVRVIVNDKEIDMWVFGTGFCSLERFVVVVGVTWRMGVGFG